MVVKPCLYMRLHWEQYVVRRGDSVGEHHAVSVKEEKEKSQSERVHRNPRIVFVQRFYLRLR